MTKSEAIGKALSLGYTLTAWPDRDGIHVVVTDHRGECFAEACDPDMDAAFVLAVSKFGDRRNVKTGALLRKKVA